MNRIETFQMIESGLKKYFQITEAIVFFNISEGSLKKYAIENALYENPLKLKKTKGKKMVLKAKETIIVMQELGYPKHDKRLLAN